MRFTPSHNPRAAPCRSIASKQYCEQLGSNRQPPPPESACSNGETVHRYTRIRTIKKVLIRARTSANLPPRRCGTNFPARSRSMQILRRDNPSTGARAARISGTRQAGLQLSATLSAYRQELVRPAFAKVLPISGSPLTVSKFLLASTLSISSSQVMRQAVDNIHFLTSSVLCRSARAGQNRKPSCENQPFLLQFLKCGLAGHWFGSNHDQKSRGKQRPMQTTDFTQPSSDSITCHCIAQAPRGYQTKTCSASYRISRNAQPQQTALRRATL